MKKTLPILCAAALAATLANGALAADAKSGEPLAKASGCFACHSVDKKLIGPGYKEIADKYRGNKAAEADLARKVKNGSKGVWGDIQMPANAHVKDEDIRAIVQWILSIK
jgi:cytochrome c